MTTDLGLKPAKGTPAASFNEREMQICTVARMVEDAKTYWVAGGGGPMYAVLLAIKLYTPAAQYITEDGVIAPEPMLPFEPVMTMVASRAGYRALAWGTMNTAGNHAQVGLMDYGLLNCLQLDQHGNINSTAIGTYGERSRRFGGPGGADSIAALCWRTRTASSAAARSAASRKRSAYAAAMDVDSVRRVSAISTCVAWVSDVAAASAARFLPKRSSS